MNSVEAWIQTILAMPREEICARYTDNLEMDREVAEFVGFRRDITSLEHPGRRVEPETLRQLHQHIRELPCEWVFWATLLFYFPEPIPDEMAYDLIDRDVCVHYLGLTGQSFAVQWRLADIEEHARRNVGCTVYESERYSSEEFRDYLERFPQDEDLFGGLSYSEASSDEKEDILLEFAEQHPGRDRILPQIIRNSRRHQPEAEQAESDQPAVPPSPEHLAWLARLEEAQKPNISPERCRELFEEGDADVMYWLARNMAVPKELLTEMLLCRDFPGARPIRMGAKETLWHQRRKAIGKQWAEKSVRAKETS